MPTRRRISTSLRRLLAEQAGHRCSYCRSPELAGVAMVVAMYDELVDELADEIWMPTENAALLQTDGMG